MNTTKEILDHQVAGAAEVEDRAESAIILDEMLTMQNVSKLYEKIKTCFSANDVFEINASQVSSIDTATLQLLTALKKEAVKQQKQVVITAPSRRFIESAKLLGLLDILEIDPL